MSDSVVITPTGSGQTGIDTGASLISQVARIVGGEGESLVRAQALDCLNRARIELNSYDWRFTKISAPTITLVSGTRTYSLPTAFKKPAYARLIDASGLGWKLLMFVDDVEGWRIDNRQDQSAEPYWYHLRNEFDDGLIDLYPIPNLATTSVYRLKVEYYQRLGRFSDSDVELEMPEEATNALVLGGQAWLLRERDKNSPVVAQAFVDFQRAVALLRTADRRISDEMAHFRITPRRPVFDPTMYVKLGP